MTLFIYERFMKCLSASPPDVGTPALALGPPVPGRARGFVTLEGPMARSPKGGLAGRRAAGRENSASPEQVGDVDERRSRYIPRPMHTYTFTHWRLF